ncbi:hypothetical protein D7S86_17190 [Pararobbsia silviterrae]|uniref:Zinc-ribbon domain-containing protein n=1 Tax=Pararobbsia silviterrae TaxID=1792498 RepID=A0A494XUJ4_9BURK|nr:hypothetical protein D7S86_17190 [Pararobbsia silviterrae]
MPNLVSDDNRARWYRLESAKRRLLYTLAALDLPVLPKTVDNVLEPARDAQDASGTTPANGVPDANGANGTDGADGAPAPVSQAGRTYSKEGVAFEFLEDTPDGERVMTGHDHGLITLNIAEADDAQREAIRTKMHEPYRTLLGHFRHEIGHYYFDVLVADTHWNAPFRAMFGDERADYGEALARHYREGAPPDWNMAFVSAYASAHPWEDWAETWAHYLHMVDTLDTATSCGLKLVPDDPAEPTLSDTSPVEDAAFDDLMQRWFPLTYALNSLNRSLGMPDGYPFALAQGVVEKLRFVHRVIAGGVPVRETGAQSEASASAAGANGPSADSGAGANTGASGAAPSLEQEMLDP